MELASSLFPSLVPGYFFPSLLSLFFPSFASGHFFLLLLGVPLSFLSLLLLRVLGVLLLVNRLTLHRLA